MFLFFSPARPLLPALLLAAGLASSCQKKDLAPDTPQVVICPIEDCTTPARVRDLTGLDGCGKVLELTDGTRIEPVGPTWQAFASANNQRVMVSYRPTPGGSICMVGPVVEITCIRSAEPNPQN